MELLVRVVDKRDFKDPVMDAKLTKAGDVIAVKEDGSDWGLEELKNPEWRIVRVPGMKESEAFSLMQPELPPTLDKEYPLLRKRALRLDLAKLDSLEGGKLLAGKTDAVAAVVPLEAAVAEKEPVVKVTLDDEGKITEEILSPAAGTKEEIEAAHADLQLALKASCIHAELDPANVSACIVVKEPL